MAFDDIFKLLSVREGTPQGKAIENRMINAMGGPETIRKKFQNNPDGSVVMAHTRGPGAQPEFITTLVEQIAGLFGWPWHGLERLATAGGRTTETPSGEFTTKGTSPESVNSRAFNFVLSRPAADEFAAIPPPASDPALTTWGNWAGISNGVLFGEDVGMNVWLYTANDTCWVVKMTLSGVATATLDFYTLSNWVAGMPADTAPNWVSYDGTPTPYMVTAKPSAAGRTAVKTVVLDIPAYYRTSEGIVTVKRGCVSFDGSKIILAHEVNEPDSLLFAWTGNAGRADLFAEDQWNEVVITGEDSASIDATISMIGFQSSGTGYTNEIEDVNSGAYVASGIDPWDYKTTFIQTGYYTATLSYMYAPDGMAKPVTLKNGTFLRREYNGFGTYTAYAIQRYEYQGAQHAVEFDGKETLIEWSDVTKYDYDPSNCALPSYTWNGTKSVHSVLSVAGQVVVDNLISTEVMSHSKYGLPWAPGVALSRLYNATYGYYVNYGPIGTTADLNEDFHTYEYIESYRVWGAAMQVPIVYNFTSEGAPSTVYVVGEKRWFPIVFLGGVKDYGENVVRVELTRDAFDLFTINYVVINGASGVTRIDSSPVTHLTPYGWFDVLADAVPKLAFEGSTCFSAVDGSAATFDADGRNAGSGAVKYAKYDVDTYQAQRHV